MIAIDCSKNMETSDPITVGQYSDAYATIYKANLCQRFYAAVSFIHAMGPNDDACTSDELVSIYSKLGFDQGVVDKTDSDGDGLYDILESGGIRTQNGKIIYTNPYSKDTDGTI